MESTIRIVSWPICLCTVVNNAPRAGFSARPSAGPLFLSCAECTESMLTVVNTARNVQRVVRDDDYLELRALI